MVVIDFRKKRAYENCSKTKAAELIGVSRKTIYRWAAEDRHKVYGNYELYFDPVKFNQRRYDKKALIDTV